MVSDQQAMHIVSQGISIEDGSETSPVNIITSQNDKVDQQGSLEKFLTTKRTSIKKVQQSQIAKKSGSVVFVDANKGGETNSSVHDTKETTYKGGEGGVPALWENFDGTGFQFDSLYNRPHYERNA